MRLDQRPARDPASGIEEEQAYLAPTMPPDLTFEEIAILFLMQEEPFWHCRQSPGFDPRPIERNVADGAGLPLRSIFPDQLAGELNFVANMSASFHDDHLARRVGHVTCVIHVSSPVRTAARRRLAEVF
jgi:hypothetical protein